MKSSVDAKVFVVVPNWNGKDSLGDCLDSLLAQSVKAQVVVVENGSTDGSVEFLQKHYPQITTLKQSKNLGFAGGVNVGIRYAMEQGGEFVALLNNDAVADPDWLKHLLDAMQDPAVGITTCTFTSIDKKHLDSTGDLYTVWGLPYPRGRGEPLSDRYHEDTEVLGASGGASLYRIKMLEEIGLFDEDFFAYYEDVDISFRAQLAGWKVRYVPKAIAYHQIGATSSKLKGFTTYQTMKNLQLVWYKNIPRKYLWRTGWRFFIAHTLFLGRAVTRRQGWAAISGDFKGSFLLFKKAGERKHIQSSKKVSDDYIWSIMTHDLPANAHSLRKLRATWWKLRRKRT